jgi:transcriptional antiterminator NusG
MAKTALVAGDQPTTPSRTSWWSGLPGPDEQARGFLTDVRAEMRKVVTPSRKEVQATTTVVLVTVFIFAFYFWVVDGIFYLWIEPAHEPSLWDRSSRERDTRNDRRTGTATRARSSAPRNENFKWYILHAYSGFERKVKESLESRIQAFGLESKFGRIMIPTEPVTETVNGKKKTIERVFLPGYVLIEMELDNQIWHIIKETPRVTGFLGTGDKPVALSEEEISSLLNRSEEAKEKPRQKIRFEKNESVRITDGPFANFNGVVDEVNEDRETLKVMVTIFGRSTPVELEFGKVEKIE